jgi:hypothetical protein
MEQNNSQTNKVYKLDSRFIPMEKADVSQLDALDDEMKFIFNTFCKFVNLRGWTFYFLEVHKGEIRGYLREVIHTRLLKIQDRHLITFISYFNLCWKWTPFHHTVRHDNLGFGYIIRISKPEGQKLSYGRDKKYYNPHWDGLDIGTQKSDAVARDKGSVDDSIV